MVSAVLILAALYLLAAYKVFRIHLGRYPLPKRIQKRFSIPGMPDLSAYGALREECLARWGSAKKEELTVRSYDGLLLRGVWLPAENPRGTVVLADGYHCPRRYSFWSLVPAYLDRGFSVLLYDNRATGKSEGRYITMGAKERHDTALWVKKAAELAPGLPVLVHGVSMGGATVLLSLPELPAAVKALVIDSGYCTPHETFTYVFDKKYLPLVRFLMPGAALFCRLLAGFRLFRDDTVKIVKEMKLPVLFMHGEPDGLVPTGCTRRNEAACTAPHELVILPGAEHTACFVQKRTEALAALDGFLEKYFY